MAIAALQKRKPGKGRPGGGEAVSHEEELHRALRGRNGILKGGGEEETGKTSESETHLRSIGGLSEETTSLVRTFQNRECYAQSPKVSRNVYIQEPKGWAERERGEEMEARSPGVQNVGFCLKYWGSRGEQASELI